MLLSQEGRPVPVTAGTIELDGFIAGGDFSENQPTAIDSAISSCSEVISLAYNTFDRFRFNSGTGLDSARNCRTPSNESPFGSGYLYVYRPKFQYSVDPEDTVLEVDGPETSGEEAPQYELFEAYTSFTKDCLNKIEKLRTELGTAMIAATCGHAKSSVRLSYSEDHRMDLPNLTISSKIMIYIRKDAKTRSTDFRPLELAQNRSIMLSDSINGMAQGLSDRSAIVTVHFAGAATKIDLETGHVLWVKNLTNPSPDSVRETTSLNSIAVSDNGRLLAVGGDNGYLVLLDGETGAKTKILDCDPRMFAPSHYTALKIDRSTRTLFSVALQSNNPPPSTGYNRMSFPRRDHELNERHKISRWDLSTGQSMWSVERVSGPNIAIGLNADEKMVYVVNTDRVAILNAVTGSEIREFKLEDYEGSLKGSELTGATFSDDMRLLAVSSFSGVIVIDTESGRMIHRLRAPLTNELGNPGFSGDGKRLRAFTAFGAVYDWNILSGELVGEGNNEGLILTTNGPHNMPIMTYADKTFLLQAGTSFRGGIGIHLPRTVAIDPMASICKAGLENELPPLTIRSLGLLNVWSIALGARP
jgi:WD40 repeat protein